jgi:AcrR family transcriptional regulator
MSLGTPPTRRGRRSGGGNTRGHILAAARALFAEQGYDGTSLREVARQAKVDPAMVHHFFENKEALFAACVELPADPRLVLAAVVAVPADERGPVLLRSLLTLWDSPLQPGLLALVRGTLTSRAQAALMREVLSRRVVAQMLTGVPGTPDELRLRGALVASQLMGLMITRHILHLEPLASAAVDDVVRWVGPTVQHYLTGQVEGPADGGRIP